MSNKLKGVWVDGCLWESKDFNIIEKHLLQKIKDLDNENGCTAMNVWFADFLGVSKSRVSQIISKFKRDKLISVKLKYNGKEVIGRVIKILKGGMLYFKEGVKLSNQPLSYSKEGYLEFSEESNILFNNRVNNLKECVKEKDTQIKNLKSQIESLKTELSEAKKEKEKSSAKKEKGLHQFPDNTGRKTYNPKDKRLNKQLPFNVVSARATIDALYPTWQDLEKEYNSVYSEKATKEIFEKCLKTFVEEGISRYYSGIRHIEQLTVKLLEWVKKEVRYSRNDSFNTNDLMIKESDDIMKKNKWLNQ